MGGGGGGLEVGVHRGRGHQTQNMMTVSHFRRAGKFFFVCLTVQLCCASHVTYNSCSTVLIVAVPHNRAVQECSTCRGATSMVMIATLRPRVFVISTRPVLITQVLSVVCCFRPATALGGHNNNTRQDNTADTVIVDVVRPINSTSRCYRLTTALQ